MLAISVGMLEALICGLLISGALAWMNARQTGTATSAVVVFAVCVLAGMIPLLAVGRAEINRVAQWWLLFIVMPSAIVFGVSRVPWFRTHPWPLLALGPVAFVVGLVVVMVVYNTLLAPMVYR